MRTHLLPLLLLLLPTRAGATPEPFTRRFAPTVSLLANIAPGTHLSYGAEAGLRYWLGRYTILTGLLEYERLHYADWPSRTDVKGHGLDVTARVEFTGWSDEYRRHLNAPDASVFPLVGLVTALGTGAGTGVGYRAGAGFTAFHYTGAFAFPVTLQGYYQAVYFPTARARGGVVSVGFAL